MNILAVLLFLAASTLLIAIRLTIANQEADKIELAILSAASTAAEQSTDDSFTVDELRKNECEDYKLPKKLERYIELFLQGNRFKLQESNKKRFLLTESAEKRYFDLALTLEAAKAANEFMLK